MKTFSLRAMLCGLLATCLLGGALRAAEDLVGESSLAFVPADVDLYLSFRQNRRQFDNVVKSRAFVALKNSPLVQLALSEVQRAWRENSDEDPVRLARRAWDTVTSPEYRPLIALATDAVSHEVYHFGDRRWGAFLASAGLEGVDSDPDAVAGRLVEWLATVELPNAVVGFRLSDPQAGKPALDLIQQLLGRALTKLPEEVDGEKWELARQQINQGDFLTLTIPGTVLNEFLALLDEFPPVGDAQREAKANAERVRQRRVTVSCGIWRNQLLLHAGPDTTYLANLGEGPALPTRKELQPLKEFAGRPVTNVTFLSADYQQLFSGSREIDSAIDSLLAALPALGMDADLADALRQDAEILRKDLQGLLPKAGAVASITALTDSGYETKTYAWGGPLPPAGPLPILEHAGGAPLFVAAGHRRGGQGYQRLVWWSKRAHFYLERLLKDQLPPEERQLYDRMAAIGVKLGNQLDRINQQELFPALADGQWAVVVDAETKGKQFSPLMPPADSELAIPNVSLLLGVSDAAKLRAAAAAYVKVLNQAAKELHEARPDEIPLFQIPPPNAEQTEGGAVYSYPLPGQLGIDPRITPAASLGQQVLVLSGLREAGKRLLVKQPLEARGFSLGERPLIGFSQVNWPAAVDVLQAWANYLSESYFKLQGGEDPMEQLIAQQIETTARFLACWKGVTSQRSIEGGVQLIHQKSWFRDLEAVR